MSWGYEDDCSAIIYLKAGVDDGHDVDDYKGAVQRQIDHEARADALLLDQVCKAE